MKHLILCLNENHKPHEERMKKRTTYCTCTVRAWTRVAALEAGRIRDLTAAALSATRSLPFGVR